MIILNNNNKQMKDGSIHSSDIGENVEEEDNDHITSQKQKISRKKLQQIKEKFSNSIIQNKYNSSNLEIPIEFTLKNINDSTLNSFFSVL